jgi:hypothetical protein
MHVNADTEIDLAKTLWVNFPWGGATIVSKQLAHGVERSMSANCGAAAVAGQPHFLCSGLLADVCTLCLASICCIDATSH